MKPLHFAHSMTAVDGKYVGFIRRVIDKSTAQNIGRFQIEVSEWEHFKAQMELLADFYWSWN